MAEKKYFKMACTGLTTPYIKKIGSVAGFVMGNAVTFGVTMNFTNANLYADNRAVETDGGFTNASITLGTAYMPLEAAKDVFGHAVDTETSTVKYGDDTPNAVMLGVIEDGKADGKKIYICDVLQNVTLHESAEAYTTRGESIAYVTPAAEGTAIIDPTAGAWRATTPFNTLEEAKAYMDTLFGTNTAAEAG